MRRITIIRHAKSSWEDPDLTDDQRPLNNRGQESAPMMGERLAAQGMNPDLLISSPAIRAFETAMVIAGKVGYPTESIEKDERLYLAGIQDWFEVIRTLPEDALHVFCFGHNPGLTHLYNIFSPDPVENIPTCGVYDLDFDVDSWAQLAMNKPASIRYDFPKNKGMEKVVEQQAPN
jgi:phosphohistidine phosphatase